jgi:hypothetical protein
LILKSIGRIGLKKFRGEKPPAVISAQVFAASFALFSEEDGTVEIWCRKVTGRIVRTRKSRRMRKNSRSSRLKWHQENVEEFKTIGL